MVGELNNGSAQPNISVGSIRKYPVLLPPTPLVKEFGERVQHLWETVESNRGQSSTVTSLRDALLPKLISGELRIEDAESRVERALI